MSSKTSLDANDPLVTAYRHGFFSALIAGPLVSPAAWINVLLPPVMQADIESLDRAMAQTFDEYNAVAQALLDRPQQFIERVVAICSAPPGNAMLEWHRGFCRAINLRMGEWKVFLASDTGAELFTPFALVGKVQMNGEKRSWLADVSMRENLSQALAIATVRIFERWREHDRAPVEAAPPRVRRRRTTSNASQHKWAFRSRLRRAAFGWRSSRLAITRLNEALREIRKAAKSDPTLAAEGSVSLLERISPAFEHVDSSSGALGAAVYRAVEELADVFAAAPLDRATRERWLERLWQAYVDDDMGYLDNMDDLWGKLCASSEIASAWAEESISEVRAHWQRPRSERGYLKGAAACLSALFTAERYQDILDLLQLDESSFWPYREWGFRALVAMGRRAEALRYADASNDINSGPQIARACEELLLASGMADEAYERYAPRALREEPTYAGTFRAMCKRYPQKSQEVILRDLVARRPGNEGKWFAAAKDAGFYDMALHLANTSPCDPKTLARAARDFAEELPEFALEASAASLRWMAEGYGYELSDLDVIDAYEAGLRAAERLDRSAGFVERAKALVEPAHPFFREALAGHLGFPRLPQPPRNQPKARRSRR